MPSPADSSQVATAAPASIPSGPTPFMKTCPRCNSVLFADSEQCFECLFDYNNPSLDYAGSGVRPDLSDEFPLDEPVPIDAYSQDYPTFESDTRESMYSDSFPMDESDRLAEEAAEVEVVDEEPALRLVATEPIATNPSTVEAEEDSSENGQDAGLFAEPTDSKEGERSVQRRRGTGVHLGVLVHWRGMEMTTALGEDRLTIGRDRSNDIAIASFDVPAFAAAIEPADDGAEIVLLTEGIEARLDGAPINGTVHFDASQEVDLYGARFSLIRLD